MSINEWAFLGGWCGVMRTLFAATGSSAKVWKWGPDYNPALQFTIIPPRNKKLSPNERLRQLQTLREGISLFAAVAWINVDVLSALLGLNGMRQRSEEVRHHELKEAELPVFVELEVARKLCNDPSKDSLWIRDDLETLCCQLDEHNTSDAFHSAWAKIEELSGAALRGLAIPVRVIIGKHNYYSQTVNTASPFVWDAIKSALDPEQVRWGWFSSTSGRQSTLTRRYPSSSYASAVIDSVNAKNELSFGDKVATPMEVLAEMGREVRLSLLQFCVAPHLDSQTACRMVSSLLCGESSPNALTVGQRGVNHADVNFEDDRRVEMRALWSALAVTRSCRSVTFTLRWKDSAEVERMWRWVAYAVFSSRARSRSSVRQVTIYNAWLDSNTLRSLSKILTCVNPEQELFAATKGTGRTSDTALDSRGYHLGKNAGIRVTEEVTGIVHSWNSADIFHHGEASGVVLVNPDDDVSSEWTDVLVPGIGLCQVQRTNLVACDHVRSSGMRPDMDLQLQFSYLVESDHLTAFLRLVGGRLRSIWLDVPDSSRAVNIAGVLESCPHLQELTIRNVVIPTNDIVRACEQFNSTLRRLECHFDDLGALAVALGNAANALARTLRWWHCDVMLAPSWADAAVQRLAQMLTANKVLQYLTVVGVRLDVPRFKAGLRQFHLQVLDEKGELSVEPKLAFLSAFQLEGGRQKRLRLHAPDNHVATKIFEYAAEPAVRKVNVIATCVYVGWLG